MSAAQTRQQELIELVKKQVHLEGSEHTSANNIGVLNLIKTWLSSLDADDLLAAEPEQSVNFVTCFCNRS